MEQPYPSAEFEAEVSDEGMIKLPDSIASQILKGKHVTVRLTYGVVPQDLRKRHVTEAEIEDIALRQLEQRENVIRFLKAGGTLSSNKSFAKRASQLLLRKP